MEHLGIFTATNCELNVIEPSYGPGILLSLLYSLTH